MIDCSLFMASFHFYDFHYHITFIVAYIAIIVLIMPLKHHYLTKSIITPSSYIWRTNIYIKYLSKHLSLNSETKPSEKLTQSKQSVF